MNAANFYVSSATTEETDRPQGCDWPDECPLCKGPMTYRLWKFWHSEGFCVGPDMHMFNVNNETGELILIEE